MPISAVLFLVGFAVGCLLAFVRHPVYGLLTYIATLYFDPNGQWWGHTLVSGVRWELIPAFITLLALLIHRRRAGQWTALQSGAFKGFVAFIAWIIIQFGWALDSNAQGQLLTIWSKFLIVTLMICSCVDSWRTLRLVLWAHVLGCVYMGWIAHVFYSGGRFEGFGLGSIGDANTGALVLATGFLATGSLYIGGSWRVKAVLLPAMGLIANGLIATESRGGFLALVCGGLGFIALSPKTYRKRVIAASALGLVCILSLTSANYWHRIQTIEAAGAQVSGVDTGYGRLVILKAQWHMFQEHPFGCGHACTDVLSPQFVAAAYLSSSGIRSSHNTFMTMLVDHGIPGGMFYAALLLWIWRSLRRIAPSARSATGFPSLFLPSLAGVMIAIVIGDLFGQYVLLEVRVWFVSLLISYAYLLKLDSENVQEYVPTAEKLLDPGPA